MNAKLSMHLTEEAVHDLLIGTASAETRRHIAACDHCRSRVDAFLATVANFNQASLSWSEAKAAPLAQQAFRPRALHFAARPYAWSAATAAFLIAAALSWHYQPGHHQPGPNPAGYSAPSDQDSSAALPAPPADEIAADQSAQIEEDNQLLRNVYSALSDEPASPLREYATDHGDGAQEISTEARTQ